MGSNRPANDENRVVLKEAHMDKQKNTLLIFWGTSFFYVLSAIGSSMAAGPLLAYTQKRKTSKGEIPNYM